MPVKIDVSRLKTKSSQEKELSGKEDRLNPIIYELFAYILHLGKTTEHGHYVVDIKKERGWVCFNDNIVFESTEENVSKAYLAFYKRVEN